MSEQNKGKLSLKLQSPIEANGSKMETIEFREPKAADLITCGDPLLINFAGGSWEFNIVEMTEMMALLSDVPPSSIRMMSAKDWKTCAVLLAPFFLPAQSE